jgi:serine/threonine-protein kinase HipA
MTPATEPTQDLDPLPGGAAPPVTPPDTPSGAAITAAPSPGKTSRRKAGKAPAPFKHVERITVHLWGDLVGAVARDPVYGYYVFAYAPGWARCGVELAPLHMPLAEGETYIFPDLPELTYKRLPAMLSDALPDDFGNALINRYMAERGVSADNVTALDRLAYMGERSMGALSFRPAHGPRRTKATAIELSTLVTEARSAVTGQIDHDDSATAALRTIIDVGTSAGGARAKAVIAWNPATDEIRSGQVDAPPGFEHWLLKFDGIVHDVELGPSGQYGRIEYAYHLMARDAGIDMTDCRLLHENGRAHFMTRRFDRDAGHQRHHTQTLCAIAHLDYKKKGTNSYEQLFMTIKQLQLGYEAMEEAFRRMVFNILAKNCDDHTKNFSFRLRQGATWELAPAYDVTFAHNPKGEWTHQHLMSVGGKFKDFALEDLHLAADRFGVGSARKVIGEVRDAIARWPAFAQRAGVDPVETGRIGGLHLRLE